MAAVALLGCFVPAPVSAGTPGPSVSLGKAKGLEYMRGRYQGVVTQTGQPVACAEGRDATSGGGVITGPPGAVFLNESYPTLPGPAGWTTEGTGTSGGRIMDAYVICSNVDTNVGTAEEEIGVGSSATQNAFCPSGEKVVGGGIEAPSSGILIGTSYPPELITDRWFGLAKNTGGASVNVTVHAVCTDNYTVRYRNSRVFEVDPGESRAATALCRSSEAVLGGGFVPFSDGLPASGGSVKENRPSDSQADPNKVPDDGWRVTYHNDAVVTHRLLVRAVCLVGMAPS